MMNKMLHSSFAAAALALTHVFFAPSANAGTTFNNNPGMAGTPANSMLMSGSRVSHKNWLKNLLLEPAFGRFEMQCRSDNNIKTGRPVTDFSETEARTTLTCLQDKNRDAALNARTVAEFSASDKFSAFGGDYMYRSEKYKFEALELCRKLKSGDLVAAGNCYEYKSRQENGGIIIGSIGGGSALLMAVLSIADRRREAKISRGRSGPSLTT